MIVRTRRLASLVAIVTLVGTPAVVAACAALCGPGMSTMAGHMGAQGARSAGNLSKVVLIAPTNADAHSACDETSRPPASPSDGGVGATSSSPSAPFVTSGHGCCLDDGGGAVTAMVEGRTGARALLATAAAQTTTVFAASAPSRSTPSQRPPVSPPAPTRSPLILRI